MKKRILSMILALSMVLSILPVSAFADAGAASADGVEVSQTAAKKPFKGFTIEDFDAEPNGDGTITVTCKKPGVGKLSAMIKCVTGVNKGKVFLNKVPDAYGSYQVTITAEEGTEYQGGIIKLKDLYTVCYTPEVTDFKYDAEQHKVTYIGADYYDGIAPTQMKAMYAPKGTKNYSPIAPTAPGRYDVYVAVNADGYYKDAFPQTPVDTFAIFDPSKTISTVTLDVDGKITKEVYAEDEDFSYTAPEKDGCTFSHWEAKGLPDGVKTTEATISFTMPANDVKLKAVYEKIVVVQKAYLHVVYGSEGMKDSEHVVDEPVTLTAPELPGSTFKSWQDPYKKLPADVDLTKATITFKMPEGEVYLIAYYEQSAPQVYTLTVKDEKGEDSKVESYLQGDSVTYTAPEVAGSTFIRWEVEGLPEQEDRPADFFTNSVISFYMPANNVTLTPVYAKKYTLTLTGGKTEKHFEGDTVTVNAPEQPGFTFNGWKTLPEGAVVDGKTVTFTMPDHDVTVEADLIPTPAPDPAPKTFALKVNKAQATLQNGAAVDLTAVPVNAKLVVTADEKEGYTFTGWETEGLPEGTDITGKTITFEMPANDVKITAKMNKTVTKTLKIDKATVTLQDGSAVADLNAVPVGTKLVATADADTDTSVFKKWNCTGLELTEEQSTARELKFDMPDQDVELTAVFEAPATPDPEPTPDPKPNPDPEPTPDPDPAPAPSDDGSAAVIVAATAVGGAAVGVGAYMVGTTVYLKSVLPEGMAIPANRQQLAVALWTAAGKPATQSTALFNDVAADAAELQAIRWAVDTDLMTAQDGNFNPGSRVSRLEVIRTWKNYQKRG